MLIVLNEYEWAEEMIAQNSLGDNKFETLCRVAKYYMMNGYKGKSLRVIMNSFLLKCDPYVSVTKWEGIISTAIARAKKYNIVMIDELSVTKPEMDAIKSLDGKQIRRLAFTLLCLSKYYKAVNPNADGWVNTPDNEIMKMANIRTSVKKQSAMFQTMNRLGMIRFSKKVDNTNIQVCFAEDGDTAVSVTDMRNLGYQYMMHIGESGYMICQSCGAPTKYDAKSSGRKPKYCPDCANTIKLRQVVECVMRRKAAEYRTSV